MAEQQILTAGGNYRELDFYIQENELKTILLVCDSAFPYLQISKYFSVLESRLAVRLVRFDNFQSNPLYESVVEGVEIFRRECCDSIIAVGGGSAMDVAKCIKLYSSMDRKLNYLKQLIIPNDVKLIAVPTTAGTGSEATRYAVIYYEGEKQSVTDDSCIPSAVLMDASTLKTLPEYQRKSTMLDALCHAIESFWSVNSTEESKLFSRKAIQSILANMEEYLKNEDCGNEEMLRAANMAGKAINITQTTAGHAMCYKLTSLYGIAHGHAAALCVARLWPYMIGHMERCTDPRGKEYLERTFGEIAEAMGCKTIDEAILKFQGICRDFALFVPVAKQEDYIVLREGVNPDRLKNNPVALDTEATENIYRQILEEESLLSKNG